MLSVGSFKGPRLTETAIRALLKRHGPERGMFIARQFAYVLDGRDLYADRVNMGERKVLREDFLRPAKLKATSDTFTASVANTELVAALAANQDFVLGGTSAVDTDSVVDSASGGNKLTAHATTNDVSYITPSTVTAKSAWATILWPTAKEVHFHAVVIPRSASVASSTMFAGLKLTTAVDLTTDDDHALFWCAQSTGSYWGWSTRVATATNTLVNCTSYGGPRGVADPAKDVAQLLSILIDEDRYAWPYIDGVQVADPVQVTSANVIPILGVKSNTTTTKSITVRDLAMSRLAA